MDQQEKEFKEWLDSLSKMDFENQANTIKEVIIKKGELEEKSKKYFSDCFDYFMKQTKLKKPIDTSLMKIYLVNVKGWKEEELGGFMEMMRIFIMLSMCGFKISTINENK